MKGGHVKITYCDENPDGLQRAKYVWSDPNNGHFPPDLRNWQDSRGNCIQQYPGGSGILCLVTRREGLRRIWRWWAVLAAGDAHRRWRHMQLYRQGQVGLKWALLAVELLDVAEAAAAAAAAAEALERAAAEAAEWKWRKALQDEEDAFFAWRDTESQRRQRWGWWKGSVGSKRRW